VIHVFFRAAPARDGVALRQNVTAVASAPIVAAQRAAFVRFWTPSRRHDYIVRLSVPL
jgi:hypothetical protein